MSEAPVYKAQVYSREISYENFKGQANTATMSFALDPMELLTIMSTVSIKKSKSANPAKRGQDLEISDEEQLKLLRRICVSSSGTISDDGEFWIPFVGFNESIVGQAFMAKLAASDADRKEFSEAVILSPFRAFVGYASAEPDNTPAEVAEFEKMLGELENVFAVKPKEPETLEEKRAKLAALQAEVDNGE